MYTRLTCSMHFSFISIEAELCKFPITINCKVIQQVINNNPSMASSTGSLNNFQHWLFITELRNAIPPQIILWFYNTDRPEIAQDIRPDQISGFWELFASANMTHTKIPMQHNSTTLHNFIN